jgi:hypothetical protein
MAFTLPKPSSNSGDFITVDFQENVNDLSNEDGVAGQSRWSWAEIDEKLWSKSFPYQLAVLEAQAAAPDDGSNPAPSYKVYNGTVFTLPINPEDLVKEMPFASTVQATLDGVVEQHGGVPFRDITMAGTFGVLPARESSEELTDGVMHQIQGIFGGTIQAAQQTIATATAAVGGVNFQPNVMQDVEPRTTGYYQYREFQRFLESYAEAKRTDAGTRLRLALVIWKEQAAYLVTPRVFRVVRTKDSPFEYRFTLQLRAWKRIDSNSIGLAAADNSPTWTPPRNAAWAKQLLQRLDLARKTLADARDTLLAVRSDFDETVGQAMRQTALFVKDAVGLTKSVVDFPESVGRHIGKEWSRITDTLGNLGKVAGGTDGWPDVDTDPKAIEAQRQLQERITEVQRDPSKASPEDPVGLGALLADPENEWLRSSLQPDSLNLGPATRDLVNAEVDKSRALTTDDFRTMQEQAYAFMADYADKVGLGSESYNTSLGRPTAAKLRDPVDSDYDIIASLGDVAGQLGRVAAFGGQFERHVPTTIEYVAGVANEAGIAMRVPRSKFAVPFPYQGTLERLSEQYLGDSQRWFEIAALNDLREPFVDETGNTMPLLVLPKGTEFVVADASGLVLGQSVTLLTAAGRGTSCIVLSATKVAPAYWVVQVNQPFTIGSIVNGDGSINYGSLQYFDIHTVHGGQVIYIPSDQASRLESPYAPSPADLQRMLQVGDVDGMLTESGDMAIQPNGEWPFVYGLQSIIQWARTAVSTPKGSMVLHPQWGLPLELGESIADTSAADILKSLQAMFTGGPSFVGVRSAAVNLTPPVAKVSFELAVAGVDALIPITFNLPR